MKIELNLREDLLENFPNFEYFNCKNSKLLNFSIENNLVGQQQESFLLYWLLKQAREYGGVGLDAGCGQDSHIFSIGINNYFGSNHPIYGGKYSPQITSLVENMHEKFNPETFSWIIMSHILEHVKNPIITFRNCCKLLRKNGIIILLMPDARYEPHPWDKTHINFFTPDDFKEKIINTNLDLLKTEIFDDLDNMFSISYVGRRI